jgi:hypothetical protein
MHFSSSTPKQDKKKWKPKLIPAKLTNQFPWIDETKKDLQYKNYRWGVSFKKTSTKYNSHQKLHYSKNKSSHFFELRYFFYILRDLNQTWSVY